MPRCQRTFRALGSGVTEPGSGVRRWICAHCADKEVYEAVRDGDLLHYAELACAYCHDQFGVPPDSRRPLVLLLGLRPECVFEPGERRYDLYLQRGSDPWQLRLQVGHEMFHRVCSRGRIFHWTHEMLACLVSTRLLRSHGLTEYAEAVERGWQAEADRMPLIEMLRLDLWTVPLYPPGLYGRAYATGVALIRAVGWDRLRRLPHCLSPAGAPDVERWMNELPPDLGARARDVLARDVRARDVLVRADADGVE